MVSVPRRSFERQQKLSPRRGSDLGKFHRTSKLRRVLEGASDAVCPHKTEGTQSQRSRLVGPGRRLRSDENLRNHREERSRAHELSRRRTLESRRLGSRSWKFPW